MWCDIGLGIGSSLGCELGIKPEEMLVELLANKSFIMPVNRVSGLHPSELVYCAHWHLRAKEKLHEFSAL